MTEGEQFDQESDAGGEVVEAGPSKRRGMFENISRGLTEKQLLTPAALRFLLDESERLHAQVAALEGYREQYHQADKARAILEQKLKVSISQDIIFGLCLTVGALLAGVAPAVWQNPPYGHILAASGVVLIACGAFAKGLQK